MTSKFREFVTEAVEAQVKQMTSLKEDGETFDFSDEKAAEDLNGTYLGSLVKGEDSYQFWEYPNDYVEVVHTDYDVGETNVIKDLDTKAKCVQLIMNTMRNGYTFGDESGFLTPDD